MSQKRISNIIHGTSVFPGWPNIVKFRGVSPDWVVRFVQLRHQGGRVFAEQLFELLYHIGVLGGQIVHLAWVDAQIEQTGALLRVAGGTANGARASHCGLAPEPKDVGCRSAELHCCKRQPGVTLQHLLRVVGRIGRAENDVSRVAVQPSPVTWMVKYT